MSKIKNFLLISIFLISAVLVSAVKGEILNDPNKTAAIEVLSAARMGDFEKVKLIVEEMPQLLGIKPNEMYVAKSNDGRQMLHWAGQEGYTNIVKYLIDKGVDVNAKSADGRTPLHYAVGRDSLESAKLLVANDADVNAKSADGRTPLHYVAFEGDYEVAKFLLDNGAKINIKAVDGRTALNWAMMNNTEVAELLQSSGAITKKHVGIWGLLPAILAVGLAVWSRRVIESLLLGILSGTLMLDAAINGWGHSILFSGVNLIKAIAGHGQNPALGINGMGLLQAPERVYILMSILLLGGFVRILNKSGGAMAFGNWISKIITSEKGAQTSTAIMGCSLFTSAYFSSLATGTVFRPIFDKMKISRAKLGFLINATSAPINTLVPFSGWIAYMSILMQDNIPGCDDGFKALVQTEVFNFYCIFLILFVFFIATGIIKDFGPMRKVVEAAKEGHDPARLEEGVTEEEQERAEAELKVGQVSDMILPMGVTITCLVTLGLWNYTVVKIIQGVPVIPLSGFQILIISYALGIATGFIKYVIFGEIKVKEFLDDVVNGSKTAIIGGIVITLAVTLGDLMRNAAPEGLGGGFYLEEVAGSIIPGSIVPFGIFILACLMSFATGTSWGVWAICMPIAIPLTLAGGGNVYLAAAAVLSGGAFGDQCSPISDTCIMASIGSGSNVIDMVRAQTPYGVTVAVAAAATFLVAGFIF